LFVEKLFRCKISKSKGEFMKYLRLLFCLFAISITAASSFAQNLKFEKGRHISILRTIKEDIKKQYYDPNFRGINLDEKFNLAEEKLNQATSIGQMSGIIAQTLVDFKDSHLFFAPPGKANKTKYGFEMQMFGEKCFVTKVYEKGDAYKKGLRIGDEIAAIEKIIPTRENMWLLNYFYRALRPKPLLNLEITKDGSKIVPLQVEAKIIQGRLLIDLANSASDFSNYLRESENSYIQAQTQFVYKSGKDFMIWQMPAFNLDPSKMDSMVEEAEGFSGLIIDLRGNGGGRVDSLKRLIANFFDKDIKVGDEKTRKESNEVIAKTRKKNIFKGNLIVLIDSESGSASEIFAKVIQLEKRGKILGDISAGAVMESRFFSHQTGVDIVAPYGVSVTIADMIMTDGKSLENIGVTPDEIIIPAAQDLANKRDIVLAKAVKNLGFNLSSEEAGSIFAKEKDKYKENY
jgi:C-terminal processing protease CtpA/Prc